jgi:ketosteroid isomerase-like protein
VSSDKTDSLETPCDTVSTPAAYSRERRDGEPDSSSGTGTRSGVGFGPRRRQNFKLVGRAFGAVTIPGDPGAMIAASHTDFEMHLVGVGGELVYYAGASGIREFFCDVAQSWESFRFKAMDLRDLGDRLLVLGHVRGRGRLSGVEVDDRWAWIVELRDGRAASLRGFLDHRDALEAAGLRE